jgi:hypothetical protein
MRFYIINGAVPLLAFAATTTRDNSNDIIIDSPSKDEADAGILSKDTLVDDINSNEKEDILLRSNSPISSYTPTSCPANNYIICADGFDENGISCATACNGQCCVGFDACTGFTGKICRDGSCNGYKACKSSIVPLVVNSCENDSACAYAGRGGTMGQIVNSCTDMYACYKLGWNGFVGNVQDSCNGLYACRKGGSSGGSIGSITRSCNDYQGCFSAGVGSNGGILTDMKDCCNSWNECLYATETSLPASCRSMTKESVHSHFVAEIA